MHFTKNSLISKQWMASMRHSVFQRSLRLLAVGVLTFLALGASTGAAVEQAPQAPSGLLVELHPKPLAVEDLAAPRLSWIVQDPRRGAVQSAYQVLIASTPGRLTPDQADVWDSGRIDCSGSASVAYTGPALKPASRYYWTVRTWDAAGAVSAFAEPAVFGTALKDQWIASAIWAEMIDDQDKVDAIADDYPHSGNHWALLRTDFTLSDTPIAHATLYAAATCPIRAAQHVFRAEINGDFVGVGPTRGYDGMNFYNAFDVTDRLQSGTNTLAFVAYAARNQAVQAQLEIVYADGQRQRVVTNTKDWQARSGSDLFLEVGNAGHPSYYYAPREYLRADRWPHGFSRPDFDAADWDAPVARSSIANLTGLGTRNLKHEIRTPIKTERIGADAYRLDFGRNVVGGLRLTVNGAEGDVIDIRLGEELNDDGSVRFEMRTRNHYRDRWTLAEGEQTLEHFGYRVFRHAEVHGLPEGFDVNNLVGVGLVYPFDLNAAAFSSSDPHLDEVWEFCRDSIRLLNMELYMDTPSRERRAYEGDAYLQQLAHYALDRDYTLARHSIEYLYFNYTWPTEWKLTSPSNAWRDYLQTGDGRSAEKYYELLRDTKTLRPFMDERNLVVKEPGRRHNPDSWTDLIDWPRSLRDGYVFSDVNTVINAYNYRTLRDLGSLAQALGRDDEGNELSELAQAAAVAINEHLFDPAKNRYRDGLGIDNHALHASIFPLAYGIGTEREASAAQALIDDRIVGNIFSASYQVEALFALGHAEGALDLLTTDDIKSWRNMIAIGAGTTMETWDPSFKGNTTFSHPAAASPVYLIPMGLFGIDALAPAHRRFTVEPRPGGLENASIRVPTLSGTIEAAFQATPDRLHFQLTVPANTTAELRLPAGSLNHIREGDKPVANVTDIRVLEVANGYVKFELAGGSYQFSVATQ